jgi:hypothetical protein
LITDIIASLVLKTVNDSESEQVCGEKMNSDGGVYFLMMIAFCVVRCADGTRSVLALTLIGRVLSRLSLASCCMLLLLLLLLLF